MDREPSLGSAGLTQVEAKRLLTQFGPNEPAPAKRTAPLLQLLILLANPLAIILLVASGISAAQLRFRQRFTEGISRHVGREWNCDRFGLNNEDHDLACVIRDPDQHSFSSTLS